MVVPAMLAAYVGTRIFARMSTHAFRYAVTALLAALAMRIILT